MNKNIKIAKQLIKLAKSLISYRLNNDQDIKKYFDDIEEYYVNETLSQYGWQLYDRSQDINKNIDGEIITVGRHISVQPADKALTWQELKRQIDGTTVYFDNNKEYEVIVNCDKKGPSGYGIIVKFFNKNFYSI